MRISTFDYRGSVAYDSVTGRPLLMCCFCWDWKTAEHFFTKDDAVTDDEINEWYDNSASFTGSCNDCVDF